MTLIKMGGAALKGAKALPRLLAWAKSQTGSLAVVHGGGPEINRALSEAGLTWSFAEGQRITTPAMMDIIEDTLNAKVNAPLRRAFATASLKTRGFCGARDGLVWCRPLSPTLGRVGEIRAVDARPVTACLGEGEIPVLTPLGRGEDGQAYNVNADWAAVHWALGLEARELIFLTDQPGILDANGKVISRLTLTDLNDLIASGVVSGGMLAKARAMAWAARQGLLLRVTHADALASGQGTRLVPATSLITKDLTSPPEALIN